MGQAESLELLARGAAVGAFIGLAVLAVRERLSPARLTTALFCIAAAAHTLTQQPGIAAVFGWAIAPVWAFSVMGAGLFWAFVLELFEDRGRMDLRRFAPAVLLLVAGGVAALTSGQMSRAFLFIHNLASAALIVHALACVARGWRGDLVETRRRLRGPILAASAIYALAVIAVQTGELFLGSAAAFSPLGAVSLLMLGLVGLAVFGRMDADLFAPVRAPTPSVADVPASAMTTEDAGLASALDRVMRVERAYREEGLTISILALRLNVPEHRLRRLINQQLGHRNFSAFINQWRLADARLALTDPSQRDVPISTIGLDAGFQSLGPFNRAFKLETGLTPTEFRARSLGGGEAPS